MVVKECRWCQYMRAIYSQDEEETLKSYIQNMPQDIKVSNEVHTERLLICSQCEDCISGICKYCGCFVAARTVKKTLSCPKPGNKKW